MSMKDSIDIYHRNNHEYEHFAQQIRSQISPIGQKVNNSLHRKRSRGLARVYSGRNQDNRLIEPKWPFLLWKQIFVKQLFILILFIFVIVGSYR